MSDSFILERQEQKLRGISYTRAKNPLKIDYQVISEKLVEKCFSRTQMCFRYESSQVQMGLVPCPANSPLATNVFSNWEMNTDQEQCLKQCHLILVLTDYNSSTGQHFTAVWGHVVLFILIHTSTCTQSFPSPAPLQNNSNKYPKKKHRLQKVKHCNKVPISLILRQNKTLIK